MTERLDKILSTAGYGRKEAKGLVAQGRVAVDGAAVTRPEAKCSDSAAVTVDDVALRRGHIYLMLHKPAGVVSATADARERTVLDLLPEDLRRRELFPVGRLDKDTTGLLLLTDDGALAHDLLSPRKHVDKTYLVTVDGVLDEADRAALAAGLVLGDGLHCQSAKLEVTGANTGLLTIHEGKFHQVKRMLAQRGNPVTYLERVRMGGLALDPALERGAYRFLTETELKALRKL